LTENSEKQKSRIAGAFEKHFRHFGYKKTTVDEVAAELGISKKTIYKTFESKEGIFRYIISRKAEARKAMVEEEIKDLVTATAKLEAMIRINFREFRKIHCKRNITPDSFNKTEMASSIFRKTFFGLMKEIVHEGTIRGEFASCEASMTARYIQALLSETFICIIEDPEGPYEEYLICSVKKLLGIQINSDQ
jgi:AcrR family transcriptional regulator